MTTKVNRTSIELFEGAQVRHALIRYFSKRNFNLKKIDTAVVRDNYGHMIDLNAPLRDGQTIKCRI